MAHRALLSLAILGLLVVSPGARAKGPEPVAQTLAKIVRQAALGDEIGIHVVRLHDGAELYRNRAERPRNPASNQKLLTSAAALWRLGPSFQIWTRVEGRIVNGRVARLVVRPSGDPTLSYAMLAGLAENVRLGGVDTVDRIVIDDGYFDDQILPPAFDQQPQEAASFRAAISAFAVNGNSYVVHIAPGPEVDGPARVGVLSDDYASATSSLPVPVSPGRGPWFPRGPPADAEQEVLHGVALADELAGPLHRLDLLPVVGVLRFELVFEDADLLVGLLQVQLALLAP